MFFKAVNILFFTFFFITGCSLEPGSYNEAIRFSENTSTTFDDQWNDQALDDQTVGYETGTDHPYYILFYTEDFKDINMRNMSANIDNALNGAANSDLQSVPLVRLDSTHWRGVFYLPATLDDTSKEEVKFHLQDAVGEYEKCTGIFIQTCTWEPVALSDYGYDETSEDTYSDPFAIKDAIVDSTSCVDKVQVLFLEHGNTPAAAALNDDCSLKTKIVGFSDDYDLYIDNTDTDTADFTTDFNISSNGIYLAGPFDVNLSDDASNPGWSKVENILTTYDGTTSRNTTELDLINTIRNTAYQNLTFTLASGSTLSVSSTTTSTGRAQCCYEDADGVYLDQCTAYDAAITACPLNPDDGATPAPSGVEARDLILPLTADMACTEDSSDAGNWTCEDSSSSGTVSSDEWKYFHEEPPVPTSIPVTNGIGAATSDPFAIRADHFTLYPSSGNSVIIPSDINAGKEYNMSLKAEDSANNLVNGYSTTLTRVNLFPSITSVSGRVCSTPSVDVDDIIVNDATADVQNFSVNNISDSAMALKVDIRDSSWSAIDQPNDCIENSSSNVAVGGKVGCDIALTTPISITEVKPVSFAFMPMFGTDSNGQPIFIADAKDAHWTYLDDTMDQSLDINFSVRAVSVQGAVLTNFDAECLAQDVNLTVPYEYPTSGDYANLNFIYNYAFRNLNGSWGSAVVKENTPVIQEVKINMPALNFHSGELSIGGHLNFLRTRQVALNPFLLTFKNAIIDDASDNIHVNYFDLYGYDSTNSPFKYLFLYAASQVNIESNSTDSNVKKVVVDYDFYCDRSCQSDAALKEILVQHLGLQSVSELVRNKNSLWWIKNPQHQVFETLNGNTKHGGVTKVNGIDINSSVIKSSPESLTQDNITSVIYHDNNATIIDETYDETKGYPFQRSIDISVKPWLEYNKFGSVDIAHRVDLRFMQETKEQNETGSDGNLGLKVKKQNNRRVHW